MDIYSLLRQDHQRLNEVFDQIESCSADGRAALFETLKKELTAHKEAEESTFYAALSTLPEISDQIEEALEEHVDIDELLHELDEIESTTDTFLAQLAELREEFDHHVGAEEDEVFNHARELLTEEQADKIAEEMKSEKERLLS